MAERQALELATNNAWLCPDKNKQTITRICGQRSCSGTCHDLILKCNSITSLLSMTKTRTYQFVDRRMHLWAFSSKDVVGDETLWVIDCWIGHRQMRVLLAILNPTHPSPNPFCLFAGGGAFDVLLRIHYLCDIHAHYIGLSNCSETLTSIGNYDSLLHFRQL